MKVVAMIKFTIMPNKLTVFCATLHHKVQRANVIQTMKSIILGSISI